MNNSNHSKRDILFLMDTMKGGGAEKALLALLSHLNPDKYNVTLILYLNTGVHLPSIPSHVEVRSLYPRGHKRWFEKAIFHSPMRGTYERKKLLDIIGDRHFDATISFMEGTPAAMHRLILDKARRNISWVHTDFVGNHWSRQFFDNDGQEREFYATVDDIVFVSRDAMSKFTFDVSSRTHCIYNITDTARLESLAGEQVVTRQGFTACFVGRLVQLKHAERLIQAIAQLQQQGINIYGWIIGTGPHEDKLKQLVDQLNMSTKIKFMGFKHNPYPYIKTADVLCMTSDVEGLPMVVQEAMALGTVVVSTRCAGMIEVLSDECGVLCDNTPEAFAGEIKRLMDDSTLRTQLATKARQRMAMFEPRTIISQIEQLIPNTDS